MQLSQNNWILYFMSYHNLALTLYKNVHQNQSVKTITSSVSHSWFFFYTKLHKTLNNSFPFFSYSIDVIRPSQEKNDTSLSADLLPNIFFFLYFDICNIYLFGVEMIWTNKYPADKNTETRYPHFFSLLNLIQFVKIDLQQNLKCRFGVFINGIFEFQPTK